MTTTTSVKKVMGTEDGVANAAIASISDRLFGTRTLFCEFTEPPSSFLKNHKAKTVVLLAAA
jgi:hypothetical protein